MKVRKTRIKKTTKANGAVQFTAEYKWGFWWYEFTDMMAPVAEPRSICSDWIRSKDGINRSEQQAKELIDFYIARVRHINASLIEHEVVSVSYEGYPE